MNMRTGRSLGGRIRSAFLCATQSNSDSHTCAASQASPFQCAGSSHPQRHLRAPPLASFRLLFEIVQCFLNHLSEPRIAWGVVAGLAKFGDRLFPLPLGRQRDAKAVMGLEGKDTKERTGTPKLGPPGTESPIRQSARR